jgi:hypothetical protein
MFEPIELTEHYTQVWRSLTDQQKSVITILAKNFDEMVPLDGYTFPDAMSVDDVDAATYTLSGHYVIWRSITLEQKSIVLLVWETFVERYNDRLWQLYREDEQSNTDFSYSMFTVYCMFANQDRSKTISTFKFLTNQNK